MKTHTTSDRLKQILTARHMRQVDVLRLAKPFCDKTGVKLEKNDLSQYVSGKVEPGQEKLTILGLALGVSEAWLMGYDVPMVRDSPTSDDSDLPDDPDIQPLPRMKRWPVLGGVACGEPRYLPLEESIEAPADIHADFLFRCSGDSMINARIYDGDYVFVRRGEVPNGCIGVVRVEDSYSLKRIFHGPDYLELRPENPNYSTIVLRGEQLNAEILGQAVKFISTVH